MDAGRLGGLAGRLFSCATPPSGNRYPLQLRKCVRVCGQVVSNYSRNVNRRSRRSWKVKFLDNDATIAQCDLVALVASTVLCACVRYFRNTHSAPPPCTQTRCGSRRGREFELYSMATASSTGASQHHEYLKDMLLKEWRFTSTPHNAADMNMAGSTGLKSVRRSQKDVNASEVLTKADEAIVNADPLLDSFINDSNINTSLEHWIPVDVASKLVGLVQDAHSVHGPSARGFRTRIVSKMDESTNHAKGSSIGGEHWDQTLNNQNAIAEVIPHPVDVVSENKLLGQESGAVQAETDSPMQSVDPDTKIDKMWDIHHRLQSLPGKRDGVIGTNRSGQLVKKNGLEQRNGKVPFIIARTPPVDPAMGSEVDLSLYKELMESGRLEECVELLESMNACNHLNMDKINVFEFFSACKRRRAVKEAFRFLRLTETNTLRIQYASLCVRSCTGCRWLGKSCCSNFEGTVLLQTVVGACRVLDMLQRERLKADCIFYTTLISACGKAGKMDLMFKFFNEMEAEGIEPNVKTYGAMIDGCAQASDVPKAFGLYRKMLNQKVKPDRVIFNTLINACGRAGAVLRAFDVLADMKADTSSVAPDHFTFCTLIATCTRAGEVERALEVYNRMRSSRIKANIECYTAAVHACSQKGYLKSALSIFIDLKEDDIRPDEVFFSALIGVAGNAGRIDVAFEFRQEMESMGVTPGLATYSALMRVCSNMGDSQRAMELYKEMRVLGLRPDLLTFNFLLTALCAGKLLQSALSVVLQNMRSADVAPNNITYSILLEACDKENEADIGLELYSNAKLESIKPTLVMCDSILGLCLKQIQSGAPPPRIPRELDVMSNTHDQVLHGNRITWALTVYNDTLSTGVVPSLDTLSHLLGCLRLEKVQSNIYGNKSLSHFGHLRVPTTFAVDHAWGMYLPRSLTLFEEAIRLGIVPKIDYAAAPITFDMRTFPIFAGEVGVLVLLKHLKIKHDAGINLNSVKLIFTVERKEIFTSKGGFKRVQVSGRTGEAVTAMLRRLQLKYQGNESLGEIGVTYSEIQKWLKMTQSMYNDFPAGRR